jgi:hypothetical protein
MRIAAAQAADIAATLDPSVGDLGALADQFEAAGLDSLATHGLDARTYIAHDTKGGAPHGQHNARPEVNE